MTRVRGRDDPRRLPQARHRRRRRSATARRCSPANACRVCVVELEGARVLAPACSRKAEAGHEGAHRLRARAPLAQAGARAARLVRRPLDRARRARLPGRVRARSPSATARRRRPTRERDRKRAGHHVEPDGQTAATVARAGQGRQRALRARLLASASSATSASTPAASSTRTRSPSRSPAAASTRASRPSSSSPLPDSACVYCGNCIAVCPTGALMFTQRARAARGGHVGRGEPDRHRHDLPLLRRRLQPRAARAGQRDREGHDARDDHDVTRGNLCIKGRFGFQHVQDRARREE